MSHTLVLQPQFDTDIEASAPTYNFGTSSFMYTGDNGGLRMKALQKFDHTAIPAGATLLTAVLSIRMRGNSNSTAMTMGLYRSLVDWYEGPSAGGVPGAGINASTYNLRNANGSVAWSGGVGGGSGVDYSASAFASTSVTTETTYTWNVLTEFNSYYTGSVTNRGWWILPATFVNTVFKGWWSRSQTSENTLTITYNKSDVVVPSAVQAVAVTVSAITLAGSTINPTVKAESVGTTVAPTVDVGGLTFLGTNAAGVGATVAPSIAVAALIGTTTPARSIGTTFGPSSVIRGSAVLTPSPAEAVGTIAAPASLVDLTLRPSAATAVGTTVGKTVAQRIYPVVCTPDPLLYITNGTLKRNGQLNRLSLLTSGFLLNEWKPNITQYKDGGVWSDSALSEGRTLARRSFTNGLEVMDMRSTGRDQDVLIAFLQQLFAWQELAADYWVSDWGSQPVYIAAKSAKETNPRYALIKAMSIPEFSNPYSQPFYSRNGRATMEPFTLRIERGPWLSTPSWLG